MFKLRFGVGKKGLGDRNMLDIIPFDFVYRLDGSTWIGHQNRGVGRDDKLGAASDHFFNDRQHR